MAGSTEYRPITDIFVDGARKGWNIGIKNIVPNVLMAFVITQVLLVSGLLSLMGRVFAPVMGVFGLPGQAIMVLGSAFLAMGSAVGVAASLYTGGILTKTHITILMPAIYLMGAQVQYLGRILGTAGVRPHKMYFVICFINAAIAMFVMRFIA